MIRRARLWLLFFLIGFGGDADPPLVPNADGKVTCGMQWESTRRQAAFLRGR